MSTPELTFARKSIYALGDLTVNTALSSLGLIYVPFYLTQVAGLDPWLAGLVPLIGRSADAITDPLMGRISDTTRWKYGRRRPYFLIGAIPLGIAFSLMWIEPPFAGQFALFVYYSIVYCVMTTALTVLAIPYLALLPEMALGYDSRTSLNTFRNVGSLVGVFAAISIRPVATFLGGGTADYAAAGVLFGVFLTLPWFAVWAATFERPEFAGRITQESLLDGLRTVARHRNFRMLIGMYLTGRVAMDLLSALMILYFTYWIGRSEDFEIAMVLFLVSVIVALAVWLRAARHYDKAAIFSIGTAWWMAVSVLFVFAQPDWPRWVLFALPPLAAIGYAVVDVMPWAMLGDAIDEDDLASGERREGLYNGVFMFLRKLAGALAVFLLMGLLDIAGFRKGAEQTELVQQTIRWLTMLAPVTFLSMSLWFAHEYPLTRRAHHEISRQLDGRQQEQRA
jgi:oligogalacturonide transporter